MAIPDNFSPFEHLQDLLRKFENKKVLKYFRNVDVDNDLNLNIPETNLKYACTHQDKDTASMTIMRILLFHFLINSESTFQDEHPPILGIPAADSGIIHRPQVKLFFLEDSADVDDGFSPLWLECSFRLNDETSETMTEAKAGILAKKIEQIFGANGGYIFKKGKEKYLYLDKEEGYDFRLLARSETDARNLIEKVLLIRNHVIKPAILDKMNRDDEMTAFPTVPPKKLVFGKQRNAKRKRPIADVRFAYAILHIDGLVNPVQLYSRLTGKVFEPAGENV
ncbi:hypothetical protein NG798_09380 [Ancylothrix sp. C2]|uniref:hypothetical protein n=1 Tax=Ancylothrix sp. D3o TaxID=2953691 RepID=UPI0021BA46B1|nr:hypothetical protein [Ancylothrix sp. D3o]MCT7949997.1 hypothetical protein [Ancylothrix sp. D3o]